MRGDSPDVSERAGLLASPTQGGGIHPGYFNGAEHDAMTGIPLVHNPGGVLSRQQVLDAAWDRVITDRATTRMTGRLQDPYHQTTTVAPVIAAAKAAGFTLTQLHTAAHHEGRMNGAILFEPDAAKAVSLAYALAVPRLLRGDS